MLHVVGALYNLYFNSIEQYAMCVCVCIWKSKELITLKIICCKLLFWYWGKGRRRRKKNLEKNQQLLWKLFRQGGDNNNESNNYSQRDNACIYVFCVRLFVFPWKKKTVMSAHTHEYRAKCYAKIRNVSTNVFLFVSPYQTYLILRCCWYQIRIGCILWINGK